MAQVQEFSTEQLEELREAFKIFDKDGDGTISVTEIKEIIAKRGDNFTDAEIAELMAKVDTDG